MIAVDMPAICSEQRYRKRGKEDQDDDNKTKEDKKECKQRTNKDCLVKSSFGRKRQSTNSRVQIFSLRNFNLHFDQIKD